MSRFSLGSGPLLAGALLLASCAAVPDTGPRPTLREPDSIAAEASLASDSDAWPGVRWWNAYGDPQLAALIEEGLANSPDVAAAAARFRQAAGYAEQAGAPLLPTLDIGGEAGWEKQSYNNGFPKEFLPKGWLDRGQVAADASWDLDLWGKHRAELAAATSDALAAAVDARQARLMLTTGIADAYADLARLYAEHDIGARSLAIRRETRDLVGDRMARGLDTRGDLRQAEANNRTARADLAAIEEAIRLRKNQIAALVGAGPDRGLAIERPSLPDPVAHGIPEGVTTDLVGRRPDIIAARARAQAAASRVDAARADFFPAIRLDALVGFQALGLDNLIESDSRYGNAGAAISLPIFHGGALSGRYRGSRAAYDVAVAEYNRTVLVAYREVADAVTSRQMLDRRRRDAGAALDASEEAYDIARLRYDAGLSSYLDLLLVEERLLAARQMFAKLDMRGFQLDVALVRALGGGFEPSDSTAADAVSDLRTSSPKDNPDG